MKIYTVHEPGIPTSSLTKRAEEVVFVKEGFSLWGFLVPPFWLIANKLWFELLGFLVLSGALTALLIVLGLGEQSITISSLIGMLIVGFEGNNLRRWQLERKGYTLLASVAGRSLDDCEQRFFEAWLPYISGKTETPPSSTPGMKMTKADLESWRGATVIGTLSGA